MTELPAHIPQHHERLTMHQLTVIVPTFNEALNVGPLVARIEAACVGIDLEVLFVDDSHDDTPAAIEAAAASSGIPVRMLHRAEPSGGLSGAVVEGLGLSHGTWCLVMDGDLQHPPEMIPVLLRRAMASGADVVVASRYCAGGRSDGLSNGMRHAVSQGSIALTRAMFPVRLRNCSDPMTGFFLVRREAIATEDLQPRGFKILLELLARQPLNVVEEPFIFGERTAGESKAGFTQGLRFLRQLAGLRFGRMSRFAVIGAVGAAANIAIMGLLMLWGVDYVIAAIVAAGTTIIGNFFAQEHYVFHDLRNEGRGFARRFVTSVGFNAVEAAVRLPFLALLVELHVFPGLIAQAFTLFVAFVLRFVFHSRVVYRPRRTAARGRLLSSAPIPELIDTVDDANEIDRAA